MNVLKLVRISNIDSMYLKTLKITICYNSANTILCKTFSLKQDLSRIKRSNLFDLCCKVFFCPSHQVTRQRQRQFGRGPYGHQVVVGSRTFERRVTKGRLHQRLSCRRNYFVVTGKTRHSIPVSKRTKVRIQKSLV